MPNWNEILEEVRAAGSTHDVVRRKYLERLHNKTERNVIVYYSGWLQKADIFRRAGIASGFDLDDGDKNGFMATIHQLDRSLGLDLVLHTPGGSTAATESLVDYLRSMFANDIRAIVPQLALSAGTMVALACREIVMGKHSSLGPIDPQIGGIAAHGVIEEFTRAANEIQLDMSRAAVWQPIIAKYTPTLIGECQKAIAWSNRMVKDWLMTGMFAGDTNAVAKADQVVSELADHALTLSHARHISPDKARAMNLNVTELEQDQELQDIVLAVHHACIQTLASTPAYKLIENHNGIAQVGTLGVEVLRT